MNRQFANAFLSLWFTLLLTMPARAQEGTFISLITAETTLQTGQVYEVQLVVENVADLWVTSVEITYDPTLLYIIGTCSGSPVQPGPLLSDRQTLVPRNRAQEGVMSYTVSLLAPAEPVSGTGVLAAFRIVPLAPGSAQLQFRQANLTAIAFQQNGTERTAGEPQTLPFTPVLLELTLQGAVVTPPPEVTATPPPTSTPILEVTGEAGEITVEVAATLVNITRAAPALDTTPQPSAQGDSAPGGLGMAMLALLAISGLGMVILLIVYLRRYRR